VSQADGGSLAYNSFVQQVGESRLKEIGSSALVPIGCVVVVLACLIGSLSWAQNQHKSQPLTLWGITMDAPLPSYPTCKGMLDTRTCAEKYAFSGVTKIFHLLGPESRSEAATTPYHGNVTVFSIDLSSSDFPLVLEALTKKLGPPKHQQNTMENGFGAIWQADTYQWIVVDGSAVSLHSHVHSMDDDFRLSVLSAEAIKRAAANKSTIKEP